MNADSERVAHSPSRRLVIAAGIGTSILFVVVGASFDLQMFGDGSIFSYAVAAQDAWAFHWHNIPGRLFTYVFVYVPAETFVAFTGSAKVGIRVYGLLFFSAPLLGLLAAYVADRGDRRAIFTYACLSTACLCPLVFGAPTEMWMAHAVFWPTLAACLYAPANWRGAATVFVSLLLLAFTHEGAIIFAAAILLALALRGWRDIILVRSVTAFCAVMTIWFAVKTTIRPDDYIAAVLDAAAYKFIDIRNLGDPAFLSQLAALAGYAIVFFLLRRMAGAPLFACIASAAALAIYWIWFDTSLLAEARYNLRTVLLIATPVFGVLAVVPRLEQSVNPRAIAGAIVVILLVHVVETTKFVKGWTDYKAAVRALALGAASDPALGDPLFVSSQRIGAGLNRLAWNSTTPYLSVLVAPALKPARLVVDPSTGYFWLSCKTATGSEQTSTAIPSESRKLIRLYSCLHR
jgi:hypothetical protein